ncbi:alpha/beta hydrolase [Vitreoscilla stercoraria]|uniref:Alpha/beta hydrolase n=2 Tax=Vitreoscilla stercoraria TaxID=61 RepID=A0ABY4E954_VITST|nr:alpha/beta hydrolase [Vitreoscilla stercoraria]
MAQNKEKMMRIFVLMWMVLLSLLLNGCAMVSLKQQTNADYIAIKRDDVLSKGVLSEASMTTVSVVGLARAECEKKLPECIEKIAALEETEADMRLAALSELWLLQAKSLEKNKQPFETIQDALLESARYAYAYLFFGSRDPKQRVLESRQTQIVEYYNYAIQQFVGNNAKRYAVEDWRELAETGQMQLGKWRLQSDMSQLNLPDGMAWPKDIVIASNLKFAGLRNVYQRDGFGAELVAILDDEPLLQTDQPFSETNTAPATLIVHFQGQNLDEVLQTHDLNIQSFDPFTYDSITINHKKVPLAANFTAPYGVWLAESGFAKQAIKTLLGRDGGIEKPHVFLMQPYDPNKRILLMVHGLASSPEAWVNMANEILGDVKLRQTYQIWQVYYPTNMPIVLNHVAIRHIVNETMQHFDPQGKNIASQNMVLVGHSMGGVIGRMMIANDGGALDEWFKEALGVDKIPPRILPLVRFEPMPQIGRVVFIAAPHQGTQMAGGKVGRLIGSVVRLPFRTLQTLEQSLADAFSNNRRDLLRLQKDGIFVPNSIDNLDEKNRFVIANRNIRISETIPYHSIIAQRKPNVPLEQSNDGVVPYLSAHLAHAQSEKVIVAADHSVQEHPQAILEIRRILNEDMKTLSR